MARIQAAIIQVPKPPPNRTIKAIEAKAFLKKKREAEVTIKYSLSVLIIWTCKTQDVLGAFTLTSILLVPSKICWYNLKKYDRLNQWKYVYDYDSAFVT